MSNLEAAQKGLFDILHHASVDNVKTAQEILEASHVQSVDFADARISILWDILTDTIRAGLPIDFVSVRARAKAHEALCTAEGKKLVEDWLAGVHYPSPKIASEYARIIRDASMKRRATDILRAIHKSLQNHESNATEVLQDGAEQLQVLSNRVAALRSGASDVEEFEKRMDDAVAGRQVVCIPTGIEALDEAIGGLQASVLTMLVALPGVGKSAFLASILYSLCERRIKVGFFSLEDERMWITNRLMAVTTGVPLFNIQTQRNIHHAQNDRFKSQREYARELLSSAIIDDRPGLTVGDIVESAKDMILTHKCEVLMLDHLGEIRMSRSDRYDLDVADVLSQLRNLAKRHKIPIIVAAHARRRQGLTENDAPALTDFANSSAPERMARVAIGLSRIDGGVRASILKQTNGPTGQHLSLKLVMSAGVLSGDTL